MKKFWEIFNERMNIAEDALVYRVERTKEATPANAPILYQYGAFGRRLEKKKVLTSSLRIVALLFRLAISDFMK